MEEHDRTTLAKGGRIKVLTVDDSALVRKLIGEIIDSQPDMTLVGSAPDPLVAREKIKELNPDVLTLDIEMPRMDGLDFLEKLMRLRPMPVIMISSQTERGSLATMRALELGAVDFVTKPRVDIRKGLEEYTMEIVDKIRAAARARVNRPASMTVEKKLSADAVLPVISRNFDSTEKIIAIGASTGGTEALRSFLTSLPADSPGILITQHMPEGFTKTFANRLNGLCSITVKEAEHRERILPGHAYIAPGNRHLLLTRSGANYLIELSDGPPVSRHRPSVDVLFRSVANSAGNNAIGVIMTGMGDDGAEGMLEMKRAGAYNLAQDEQSCVVFGMPREAIERGAVHETVSLGSLPGMVLNRLSSLGKRGFRV